MDSKSVMKRKAHTNPSLILQENLKLRAQLAIARKVMDNIIDRDIEKALARIDEMEQSKG